MTRMIPACLDHDGAAHSTPAPPTPGRPLSNSAGKAIVVDRRRRSPSFVAADRSRRRSLTSPASLIVVGGDDGAYPIIAADPFATASGGEFRISAGRS